MRKTRPRHARTIGKVRLTHRGHLAKYWLYAAIGAALLFTGFWWEAQLLHAR